MFSINTPQKPIQMARRGTPEKWSFDPKKCHFSEEHTGNIAKRRLLVNPYMPEIQTECFPPALVQKLVGEFFFNFSQGNLVGNLAGILRDFSDPQNKGSKISGKFSEHFS